MEIKAEVKSISKLKDYFFLVPDYQREYVWKPDDQVEQFIIDIDNEFDAEAKEQSSYFIGSIIIVENKGKFDVIDGQQRLTTIILSLCAFRDLLKPLKSDLDMVGEEYFKLVESLLFSFDIKTKKINQRLELQYEESKDYLNKLIQGIAFLDEKTPSIIKMEQAYQRLSTHFKAYLDNSLQHLTIFLDYFLSNIEIVVIESENLSSALKIFETINQRGAGLNAMDLVKNLLFSQANESDFQHVKQTWKEITSNLQSCGEDENPLRFLRYFLISRYYDGVMREDDIYKWIISPEGKTATEYETNPLAFAKELKKISQRYADLVNATELVKDGGAYPNITNIGFVNKYKSRQHLILLLALRATVSKYEIEYLGEQIESFFFFSNTMGIRAKNNERLFAAWAAKLRGIDTIEGIKSVLDGTMILYLAKKVPNFKSTFLNLNHGTYHPLYRLRYVLGKLENTALSKAGLPIKGHNFFESLQIEHIYPQTPKDKITPTEFSDSDEYYGTVYKLGNVALLESTINQAVNKHNDLTSNWFEKKKEEYIKSDILTTNLLHPEYTIGKNTAVSKFKSDYQYSFGDWSKDAVVERQKVMLELAFETWKLNGKRLDKQLILQEDGQG